MGVWVVLPKGTRQVLKTGKNGKFTFYLTSGCVEF